LRVENSPIQVFDNRLLTLTMWFH